MMIMVVVSALPVAIVLSEDVLSRCAVVAVPVVSVAVAAVVLEVGVRGHGSGGRQVAVTNKAVTGGGGVQEVGVAVMVFRIADL